MFRKKRSDKWNEHAQTIWVGWCYCWRRFEFFVKKIMKLFNEDQLCNLKHKKGYCSLWPLVPALVSLCNCHREYKRGKKEGIKAKAFYLLPSWIVDESLDSSKAQWWNWPRGSNVPYNLVIKDSTAALIFFPSHWQGLIWFKNGNRIT